MNLFARTIVTLFLDAYAVVDSSAKASFEKVLGTWPNWTSQLFPKELIAKIEQGVRSMRQQKQGSYQPSSSHGKPHHSDGSREDPYSQNASNMVSDTCTSADCLLPSVKKQRHFFFCGLLVRLLFFSFVFLCDSKRSTDWIRSVIGHSKSVRTFLWITIWKHPWRWI